MRAFGDKTERVIQHPGSEFEPQYSANGDGTYTREPDKNVYQEIQKAGEGCDLASMIARLEAGDTTVTAKQVIYTEGTPLEKLPGDVLEYQQAMKDTAQTIVQAQKQAKETAEAPKEEAPKKEVKNDEPKQ